VKIPKLKTREEFPILIKHMGYTKICEVGVNRGDFLSVLAIMIPDHLVGVDVWDKYDEEAYGSLPYFYKCYPHHANKVWRERVQEWAEKLSFKTDIIVDFSVEAAKQFEDGYFDFVYIDANHNYDSVTADLEAWYPKVRKGGMIAGHDYHNDIYNDWLDDDEKYLEILCKDGIDDFAKKYGKYDDIMVTQEYPKSFFFVK
jgi:hypothetical protein